MSKLLFIGVNYNNGLSDLHIDGLVQDCSYSIDDGDYTTGSFNSIEI